MPRVGFLAIIPTTADPVVDLPESCADPSAALDLAALSEGNLSPHGMDRLACHVVRCSACRTVLAMVVQDTQAVDSTTKYFCDANHLFDAAETTTTRRYSPLRQRE
jgi:hypothetical protein